MTLKKLIRPLLLGVWAVTCFCLFQGKFKFHFYFIEQNQLFLFSGDYLSEFFRNPAWLSRMAGGFFQQFYHYPCAGAAILTLSLLLMGHVCMAAFTELFPERSRVRGWLPFALAIICMTVEARLYIYENAQLSAIFSISGGVAVWLACDRARDIKTKASAWLHPAIFLAALCACFWLFGFGILSMLLIELLYGLFNRKFPCSAMAGIALIACAAVPVSTRYRMSVKDTLLYPGPGKWIKYEPALKVENMLKFYQLYCRGDYKPVISLYEGNPDSRIQETSFIYALSVSQYGMLPDKLQKMKQPQLGTTIHIGGNTPMMVSRLMVELYWLIGDMTYAERVCMHTNNFSLVKRSAYLIQKLAEINLVSEDWDAAEKYLRMLRKSPVYRSWARAHTPGQMSAETEKFLAAKRRMLNTAGTVRTGDNCRTILTGLLDSNRGNVIALDYLLCSDIIAGDKDSFVQDWRKYGPRDKALYGQMLEAAGIKTKKQ